MLLKLVLNLALLLQAQTLPSTQVPSAEDSVPTAPQVTAWIADHEVWIQTEAGPRRITYDAMAAEPVAVSPHGDRVVYGSLNPNFTPDCGNTPFKYVVLVSASGQFLWKAAPEAWDDFDRLEWIDEHRIGVMLCGRANCFYWVLDASNGKTMQQLTRGFGFLWSHNRKWVAHHSVGMTTDDGDSLMFNDDEDVYPSVDRKEHLFPNRRFSQIGWSPDDKWVSFGEIEYPSNDSYVVLVSPAGNVLRESLPVDVQYSTTVDWTDSSHFEVKASGRLFRFVVDDGGLREIVKH